MLISTLSSQRSSRWGDSELGYFFLPLPDRWRGFSSPAFFPELSLAAAEAHTPAGVGSVPYLAGRRLPHGPSLLSLPGLLGELEGAVLLKPWHRSYLPAERGVVCSH